MPTPVILLQQNKRVMSLHSSVNTIQGNSHHLLQIVIMDLMYKIITLEFNVQFSEELNFMATIHGMLPRVMPNKSQNLW